jgi:hypothetical protein
MNWRKWNSKAQKRSERASHAARVRWDRYHSNTEEPPRESRIVEIRIIDSHRPMQTIRLQAEQTEIGWGRWLVHANSQRIGQRRLGRSAIADLLSLFLA